MKHILTIMLLLLASVAQCQEEDEDVIYKAPKNYEFTVPTRIIRCFDLSGKETKDTIEVNRGTVFYLIEILGDESAIIQLWKDTKNDNKSFDKTYVLASDQDGKMHGRQTYKVLKNDFRQKTRRRYSTVLFARNQVPFSGTSVVAGALVIPFKFRPSINVNGSRTGFDFSKDVQFGISGGLKQRISKYNQFHVNLLYSVGISSVTMNEFNTNKSVTGSVDIAAATHSFGLVLDLKKVQFGVFLGWDKVSDKNRNDWIYQGKPWWAIGFGYSLFSTSTSLTGGKDK